MKDEQIDKLANAIESGLGFIAEKILYAGLFMAGAIYLQGCL